MAMNTIQITITYAIFLAIVFCLMFCYTKMLTKRNQRERDEKESFELLSQASVTDNGVPANKVFKTLEESNIKINYLGLN